MKKIVVTLNSPYDIQNALSQIAIFTMEKVERIELTKLNDYSNEFLMVIFMKEEGGGR